MPEFTSLLDVQFQSSDNLLIDDWNLAFGPQADFLVASYSFLLDAK